jgi:hypothetical protein
MSKGSRPLKIQDKKKEDGQWDAIFGKKKETIVLIKDNK